MIEPDTIRLLRETDYGIKMGISSIAEVLDYVKNEEFRKFLTQCKTDHEQLKEEIQNLLKEYEDQGKNPSLLLKCMSSMKTMMKIWMHQNDSVIAELMIDGCSMGIKSLSKYLNQYEAAEERAKDIAKKLVAQEDKLFVELRKYL